MSQAADEGDRRASRSGGAGDRPGAGAADDPAAGAAVAIPQPPAMLGVHRLERVVEIGDGVVVYDALQTSVDRAVKLVLLHPEEAGDLARVREFRALVRAKAALTHAVIAPVYEAHEEAGVIFYTREDIRGQSLAALAAAGETRDVVTLVRAVRRVAEAMAHAARSGAATAPLTGGAVYLDTAGEVEIGNLAVPEAPADRPPAVQAADDIRALAQAVGAVTVAGDRQLSGAGAGARTGIGLGSSAELQNLLSAMGLGERDGGTDAAAPALAGWDQVAAAAAAAERRLVKSGGSGAAGRRATAKLAPWERARKRKAWRRAVAGLGGLALLVLGAIGVRALFQPSGGTAGAGAAPVRIPAGFFEFGIDGEESQTGEFLIAPYEVTIGEYAAFLAALAADPGLAARVSHPDLPPGKPDFRPDHWEDVHRAARGGGRFQGQKLSLNSPVAFVDWWDADAFARWRGGRLPTEEEWEKAGRGRRGHRYPWGNEFDPTKTNTADPGADPHPYWAPVDAIPGDLSEYFVHGMAGNVSEWTSSWVAHPTRPDQQVPVVRGGSFGAEGAPSFDLTNRLVVDSPSERRPTIGFRIVLEPDAEPDAEGGPDGS